MSFLNSVNTKGGTAFDAPKQQSPSTTVGKPQAPTGGGDMTITTEPAQSTGKLPFTVYDMDDIELPNTPYSDTIEHVEYLTDVDYLLAFVSRVENQTHLTLPLEAYGFSRGLFDSMDSISIGEDTYEIVECCGKPYLSCCSKVLDEEFFNDIVKNATLSIMEWGKFELPLIAPRMFVDFDGRNKIFTTMQLNTYEHNLLIKCMGRYGVQPYTIDNSRTGVSKILFQK